MEKVDSFKKSAVTIAVRSEPNYRSLTPSLIFQRIEASSAAKRVPTETEIRDMVKDQGRVAIK